jgi:uncharacterized membrane protein|tara:strand:+ start:102 stop:260 length:159 start_codon:yes stop_codon:yes gene_type:complete
VEVLVHFVILLLLIAAVAIQAMQFLQQQQLHQHKLVWPMVLRVVMEMQFLKR